MNTTFSFDPVSSASSTPVLLKQGTRLLEPNVYRTDIDGQTAVVKDYRRYRRTPLALVARWMVRHEARMLKRLDGWKHAPALVETRDRLALGMEYVPGETLTGTDAASQEVFEQLQDALSKLHDAGITHNDLHGTNIMVSGGVPVLIDFTSAWRVPRWLRRNPISRQMRRSDVANFFKMRRRLTGITPSAEEAARTAEPAWVSNIRGGWKRFYRRLKGEA